jgi:hypothetical protein
MTVSYPTTTDVHDSDASKKLSKAIRQRVAMMQGRAGIYHNEDVETFNNEVNARHTRYNGSKGDLGEEE